MSWKSISFLKSQKVWQNKNLEKSWKTPPKELYKEAVCKILWAYDDWKCQKSMKHERQCAYTQCHGSTSFLKSPMVWKNKNRKKSWKTPPKELYKEAVCKILWAYDDWKCQKSMKHERQCAYTQCHGSTSFLKSPMVWKNKNRKKSWKTPPKELLEEGSHKISWSCDDR